jgi:hypothetical protein
MPGSSIRRSVGSSAAAVVAIAALMGLWADPAPAEINPRADATTCFPDTATLQISADSKRLVFVGRCSKPALTSTLFEYSIPAGVLIRRADDHPAMSTVIGYENDGSYSWMTQSYLFDPQGNTAIYSLWNTPSDFSAKTQLATLPNNAFYSVIPTMTRNCFLLHGRNGATPQKSYFYVYSGKTLIKAGEHVGFVRSNWNQQDQRFDIREPVSGVSTPILSISCAGDMRPLEDQSARKVPETPHSIPIVSRSGRVFIDVSDRIPTNGMREDIRIYRLSPAGVESKTLEKGSETALYQTIAISDDETLVAVPEPDHIDVFDIQKSPRRLARFKTYDNLKKLVICPNDRCIAASFDDHVEIFNIGDKGAPQPPIEIIPH